MIILESKISDSLDPLLPSTLQHKDLHAQPDTLRALQRPHIHPYSNTTATGGNDGSAGSSESPVLEYDDGGNFLSVHLSTTGSYAKDPNDQFAMARFMKILDAHTVHILLKAGEALIFANKRCVHGRSGHLSPGFDGKDRFLLRMYAHSQVPAGTIIKMPEKKRELPPGAPPPK